MTSRRFKTITAAATATFAVAALAGCSAGGAASPSASGDGEPITIEFWGSALGQEKAVDTFNAAHDDVQINYTQISAGSAGGYEKMLNAVNAGNGPCLGQVSYDTIPSFATAGALEDITEFADSSKDLFAPAAWQLASVGGQVFGIPVDLGPMALFYRADLFQQYGLDAPATWEDFAADAATVHAADPNAYMTTLPLSTYDIGALAWQNGAQWFGTEGGEWQVDINDTASQEVADYWQGLVDDQLVVAEPAFDTAWYTSIQEGRVLSFVGAAWAVALLEQNAPGLAGKLSVAELPQWNAGDDASGNRGGSTNAVLKGCANPEEATEAAIWLSTNDDSVNAYIENTGIFPASLSGQDLPVLSEGSDFFNGEKIYDVFTTAARNTPDSWVWGPNMTTLQPQINDGLKLVGAGQKTLPDLLDEAQQSTVTTLSDQGLTVTE
ncbi:ABC transporter substrate-binding protein [Microbacterium radiodurans]|nr:sugar ABC transporter substrate-binding protein [Microbacterium radiodurans]